MVPYIESLYVPVKFNSGIFYHQTKSIRSVELFFVQNAVEENTNANVIMSGLNKTSYD